MPASTEIPGKMETNGQPATTSFEEQLIELCRTLEKWREEHNATERADPNEFPEPNWRAAVHALIFYTTAQVSILQKTWFKSAHTDTSLTLSNYVIYLCLLLCMVSSLRFPNVFTKRFWHVLIWVKRKKVNYPFTPLITEIARDSSAAHKLERYSDSLLSAGQERIATEEAELRERIGMLVGQPSIVVLLGSLAGAWSGWKGFHFGSSTLDTFIVVGSIGALFFVGCGFKWRIALIELTRCRAMLALEIARRKFDLPQKYSGDRA